MNGTLPVGKEQIIRARLIIGLFQILDGAVLMLWNEVKEILKHKLPEAVQHLWIEPFDLYQCR